MHRSHLLGAPVEPVWERGEKRKIESMSVLVRENGNVNRISLS